MVLGCSLVVAFAVMLCLEAAAALRDDVFRNGIGERGGERERSDNVGDGDLRTLRTRLYEFARGVTAGRFY
jgi:hypothetical protein